MPQFDAPFLSDRLQNAFTIGRAFTAFQIVIGKNQFKSSLNQSINPQAPGFNHHAFLNRPGTGGHRSVYSFYFDKTEPAAGIGPAFFFNGTEVGNINTVFKSHPEQLFTGPGFDLTIIDGYRNRCTHFAFLSFSGGKTGGDNLTTALYSGGQALRQLSHFTHFS